MTILCTCENTCRMHLEGRHSRVTHTGTRAYYTGAMWSMPDRLTSHILSQTFSARHLALWLDTTLIRRAAYHNFQCWRLGPEGYTCDGGHSLMVTIKTAALSSWTAFDFESDSRKFCLPCYWSSRQDHLFYSVECVTSEKDEVLSFIRATCPSLFGYCPSTLCWACPSNGMPAIFHQVQ